MRLSLTSTLHYVLFGLALLLLPAKINQAIDRLHELKSEKISEAPQAIEKTQELLHSEILFRY